ncbi:Roundabout-like protein 2 [Armadillidium vulgare]|nr:Roundabout-like protein 2 [Armadillidium vulgare]
MGGSAPYPRPRCFRTNLGGTKQARVSRRGTALFDVSLLRVIPNPWSYGQKMVKKSIQLMNTDSKLWKKSLVITGARLSDSGNYICKARNVYGSKESPPAELLVLVPPHLVSTSGDITGTSESTIELVCRVGGDPRPEVYWEKVSGGDLPIERMSQEENGQVLRIRHVSAEDEGVYSCRAENPVGSVSANISLTIHSRPVITVSPLEARVGVNGSVSFSCKASGNPPPSTYWTHEGTGVVVGTGQMWGEGRVFVDEFNTLTLQRVTKEDQGFYVCSAVGIAGSALARAHLEVQSVTDMPPPLIALGAPNQTLPLGTEGEMPCEAKGTPEPKIKWFFDLKVEDTGVYTCQATSASGTTSWTTSLAVASPTNPNVAFFKMPSDTALPEPPPDVSILSINDTSATLGWRRGRPGASPILGYSVQMWSPDLRGPWQSATTSPVSPPAMPVGVVVTGLTPDSRYVFVVRASNSHGLSRPSEVTPMTRTSGSDNSGNESLREIRARLAIPSLRLVAVEAMSESSLRVRWQLLVDPSLLEGVYVRYRPIRASAAALSVETVLLHQKKGEKPPNTHVITGLRPATEYEVFVTPFYEAVEGQPSSAVRSVTLESAPDAPPNDVRYVLVNSTSVRLLWSPIPNRLANGKVTGYYVRLFSSSTDIGEKVNLRPTLGKASLKTRGANTQNVGTIPASPLVLGRGSVPPIIPYNRGRITSLKTAALLLRSPPSYTKRLHHDFETDDHYAIKPTEDLYEDPDGLRLVSFSKYSNNKRCFSPEPYATTPLISDGHYKGSVQPTKELPPNIPVKDFLEKSKTDEANICGVFTPQNRLLNFNTPCDKDVHLQPIFQFPPPPPSAPDHTLSFNRRNEVGFTRFLQQQLPYSFGGGSSFGGSSSGGSQKSHESPLVGPRFSQRSIGQPESRLVPHQEISLVVDPRMDGFKDNFFHQKVPRGPMECQVPRSMSAGHGFRISPNNHVNADGEGYARPHEGEESPYSSTVGEGDEEHDGEEESEQNSSGSSCCSSAHIPTADGNFMECLKNSGDPPRWVSRGEPAICNSEEEEEKQHLQKFTKLQVKSVPFKKPRPPVGGDLKSDSMFTDLVTSPLI